MVEDAQARYEEELKERAHEGDRFAVEALERIASERG
jgi:hypothetical protein